MLPRPRFLSRSQSCFPLNLEVTPPMVPRWLTPDSRAAGFCPHPAEKKEWFCHTIPVNVLGTVLIEPHLKQSLWLGDEMHYLN